MEEEKVKLLRSIAAGGGSSDGGTFTAGTTGGVPIQGVRQDTPSTVTDGNLGTARISANRALKTDMDSQLAGEDLVNDVLKVEHRYSAFNITINGTISILKSTSGLLHNINVGMLSNPTITIFDNASGASGTILAHIEPHGIGERGTYLVDLSFTNGATAYLTAGNATRITGGYR